MTDRDPSSTPPSPGTSPTPVAKKPRSPVERVVVWGLIAVLGCVLAFEARQKLSYGSSLDQIQVAFREEDTTGKYHTLSEVRKMISGSTQETETPHANKSWRRLDVKWPSLFKDYRMEFVLDDDQKDPAVIGFTTPEGKDPEPAPAPAPPASSNPPIIANSGGPRIHSGPMQSAGGPGAGGPGAGGPGTSGPGAGGPGGGQQRGRGLIALAQRAEVVAELKLTAEQIAKLEELQGTMGSAFSGLRAVPENERADAMRKLREQTEQSVRESLDEPQFTRLRQLLWRETGLASLERDDAATAVGLSDEQKEKLKTILTDRQSALGELREAPADVRAQKRKEWDDRIRETLTEAQVKQWDELLGPPLPESPPTSSAAQ